MALDAHKNFAFGTVVTPPSPPTSGTTVVLATGDGASFGTPPFNVTVWPQGNLALASNAEVVRVTNRVSDTLTIIRAQEGSTARTIVAGDQLAATFTAKFVDDMVNASNLSSGTLPDACVPTPDLKILGAGFCRLLLGTTTPTAGQRNFGITNSSGGQLFLAPYVDDYSTLVNTGLRVDRSGSILVAADILEKGRPNPIGHWTAIGYSGANFTASAGSWTVDAGDQTAYAYMLAGRTLWLAFVLNSTSVTGTPTELRIALPSGSTAALNSGQPFSYMDGTSSGTGVAATGINDPFVRLRKDVLATGTWPNATNTASLNGVVAIPIN
jgi:hypothetical protein